MSKLVFNSIKGHPTTLACAIASERKELPASFNYVDYQHFPVVLDTARGPLVDPIALLYVIDPSLFPASQLSHIFTLINQCVYFLSKARLFLANATGSASIKPDLVERSSQFISDFINSLSSNISSPNHFFIGDSLTAADIVIFSYLFPFLSSQSNLFSSPPEPLVSWFNHLSSISSFHNAIALVCSTPEHVLSSLKLFIEVLPSEVQPHQLSTPSKTPVYITTPIYYVNGTPHVGHVYTTLLCDVVSRWYRTRGLPVYFQTGTDEHGQKVAESAIAKGLTPKQMCDEVSTMFKDVFDNFNLSYDRFIRTTDEDHGKAVAVMWNKLKDNGHIYMGVHEGWYCLSDEAFLTESQVEDKEINGEVVKVSKESGNKVVRFKEENYMFRLSSFQDKLLEYFEKNPDFIVPKFRQSEVEQFIRSGLCDFSVSRSNVSWGIKVPDDPSHTIYVWIDALTNYLTGIGFPNENKGWPADVHVLAKDITRFHAIYWPAMLMGAGLEIPKKLVIHGWWTANKTKISKSLGNVFDPFEVAQKHGLDVLRYFLCREASMATDGDYSENALIARKNSDLANDLGNLLCRAVSVSLVPNQTVPTCGELIEEDNVIVSAVNNLPILYDQALENFNIQGGLKEVWCVLDLLNKYIVDQAPWRTMKVGSDEAKARVETNMYVLAESLRIVACCLSSVMPQVCDIIFDQLAVPKELRTGDDSFNFGLLPAGLKYPEEKAILFEKTKLEE
ncbi:hypothetical protein GEMRC1_001451 [Eukaryota sp. GEM-RC1]